MTMTRRAWLNHPQVTLRWLVLIRWATLALELVFVVVPAIVWPNLIPLLPMFAILGAGAGSNLVLRFAPPRQASRAEAAAGVVMLGDTALFTALLALSGASSNPFTSAYLINVALAALLLRPAWTAAVTFASAAGFGLLFLVPSEVHAHASHDMTAHFIGMWVAFLAVGPFVAIAVSSIRSALAQADAELEAARASAERADRLAGLATMAAGAAHELATPLSVIAVAATEIDRAAENGNERLKADARLVRVEVERCRAILRQLSSDAGASMGELAAPVAVGDLLEQAVQGLAHPETLRIEGEDQLMDAEIRVPARLLAKVVHGLITNARHASPAGAAVRVEARRNGGDLLIEVQDSGEGMPPDVLARAREPFFTTKPAGRGMGLGLFVGTSIAEQLGGRLDLRSDPGRGTTATIVLPWTGVTA